MVRNDFLNVLGDAIQAHEGWGSYHAADGAWYPTRSTANNNPGNIKFVGQAGVTPDAGNFCVAPNFLVGKALQIRDLELKLAKHNTIRDIISTYAPPFENNTEAYIAFVVAFFRKRNIPVTDTMTINAILALPVEIALIAINTLWSPEQWAAAQASIDQCAAYMPQFAFSTRYVNRPITQNDFYLNPSPVGNLYSIKEDVTRPLLAPFNEGQKLNALFYIFVNTLPGLEAGGVQYGGEAISFQEPSTAFCNVLYNGSEPHFVEYNGRAMWHEFIHCLFTLTGKQDYLHQYLVQHGAYANNLVLDLAVVYEDIIKVYKTGSQAVAIAQQAVAIASADKNPADQSSLSQLLSVIGNFLKVWMWRQ